MLNLLHDVFTSMARAALKPNAANYILPENDINDHTFVCKDQSLMSIIEIHGLHRVPGRPEVERVEKAVHEIIKNRVKDNEHSVTFCYGSDPSGTRRVVEHTMEPARYATESIGIDMSDVIQENVDLIAEAAVFEENFLVVWTHTAGSHVDELKEHRKRNLKMRQAAAKNFTLSDSRDPFLELECVVNRHEAFLEQTVRDLEGAKLNVSRVDRHTCLQILRRWLDNNAPLSWRPILHGDPIPPREQLPGAPKDDISNVLWPRIDWQVGRQPIDPVPGKPQYVEVNGVFYGHLTVDLFGSEIRRFYNLFNRIDRNIPWRVTTHINGGADATLGIRSGITAFLSFLHTDGKALRGDMNAIKTDLTGDEEGRGKRHRCRLQMQFTSWSTDKAKLASQLSMLSQAIEGWGNPTLGIDSIAPAETLIAGAPGATYHGMGVPSFARTEDVVLMLPLSRPASPWDQGSLLFTTPDRKLFPYQPGSSLQTVHLDITFAKPGNGKSVLANAIKTALIMKGGIQALPELVTIDIGRSSEGQALLIRDRLPESRKHEVVSHRLRMVAEDAINMLDTELGNRFPLPIHRESILEMATLLMMAPGDDALNAELSRILPLAVDETYRRLSDKFEDAAPKLYDRGVEPAVDKHVDRLVERKALELDQDTSWFAITDALFEAGWADIAVLAHRQAMPTFTDMIATVSESTSIQRQYGKESGVTLGNGSTESAADAFMRIMGAALTEFPTFQQVTKLDFSRARIRAIDLQDVTPPGDTPSAKRKTGIMYLLALHATTSHFFLHQDYLPLFEPGYQDYHRKRIKQIQTSDKRIDADELHRAPKRIMDTFLRYAREMRKAKFQLGLISQNFTDFPKDLVKLATTKFILGQLEQEEITDISQSFDLTETDVSILSSSLVHGPIPGLGSAFLMIFTTKKSACSQVVRMRKGPRELWSYSTTMEDNQVSTAVKEILGPRAGLEALVLSYPQATILPEFERRGKRITKDADDFVSERKKANILDEIANEVVERYNARQRDVYAAAGK